MLLLLQESHDFAKSASTAITKLLSTVHLLKHKNNVHGNQISISMATIDGGGD